jgi:hypothetical protein
MNDELKAVALENRVILVAGKARQRESADVESRDPLEIFDEQDRAHARCFHIGLERRR